MVPHQTPDDQRSPATIEEYQAALEALVAANAALEADNQQLRRRAATLTRSIDDFQDVLAAVGISALFVDRELQVTWFTQSPRSPFLLTSADLGQSLERVGHMLAYERLLADVSQALETQSRVERQVLSRDGRWYLMRLLPYRANGRQVDGVFLAFVEVTDQKRSEAALRASEERLRLLIESVREYAIFSMDLGGRIDSWNSGAEQVLGYAEAEALGQAGMIIFTPEDQARGEPEREMQQAREQGRASDERWHVRKDGRRFFASGILSPLRDDNGDLRGYVKIMRDLTEQKRAEDELRQARADLERRVDARTRELAQTSQQLLGEVAERRSAEQSRIEALRRLVTAQEEERRRIARELHDQLGQQLSALRLGLAGLADGLQAVSKDADEVVRLQELAAQLDKDVDRLAIELRPVVLDDLGLRVALQQHVEEWSARHNIAAEFQSPGVNAALAPDIEIVVYRVVQEALTNVLKHAGARHVSVILEQRDQFVRAVVEDDGRGFDVEALAGLPFQGQLGLSGMQERAALVGGAVTVESEPGRGTTVFVSVPLAAERTGGADV